MTSITARLDALEKQSPKGLGLSQETLSAALHLMRCDVVAVHLIRTAVRLEQGGGWKPFPSTPQEVIDVADRLDIAELVKTDDGRREAIKRLHAEASGRMRRAITAQFGESVAQRFFPEGEQG